MTPLEKTIVEMLKSRGPNGSMDLSEYMGLCLAHPDHGYYMTRDPLGQAGDFTTAPEISQMFGEMIGAWLADTWVKMGQPDPVHVIEYGAGRGTLMADALRATKNVNGFHPAVRLHIVEISPILKNKQKEALKDRGATWHSDTESLVSCLDDSPVLIIGNEFLDALPVDQLIRNDAGWNKKIIKLNANDTICFDEETAENGLVNAIPPALFPYKTKDQVEVSLELNDTVREITKIILKQRGNALFIDYGFTHSIGGDTLQAVKNHEYCGVLEGAGEIDLTAHVNFANLSRIVMEENAVVHGPVSQADFLKRLGIEIRADHLRKKATDAQRITIDQALKRLTGEKTKDGEMGALFKAIAFSSDPSLDLAGFS